MAMVETTIIPFAQVTLNNCGQASKKGANMKTQYGARQSPFGVIPGSTAGRLSLGSSLHCTGGILNGGIMAGITQARPHSISFLGISQPSRLG